MTLRYLLSRAVLSCMCVLGGVGLLHGQIDNTGCVGGNFGIDAGLYSNIIEFGDGAPAAGSRDWFYSSANGGAGLGTIIETDPNDISFINYNGGVRIYMRYACV